MAGDFRNDPILRTLFVVLIGIFSFGLVFNLFTGGGTSMSGDHMGGMGAYGYGYSTGGLIGGLLIFLIKLFMVVLVIAILGAIFLWIKNNFFRNTESKFIQTINNDPILKMITVVTGITFVLILVFALFNSFGQYGMGFRINVGMGFNAANSIAGLLMLLTQVLSFVLVVSLIMAVIAYLKNQYEQGNFTLFGTGGNQGNNATNTGTNNQEKNDMIGTIE